MEIKSKEINQPEIPDEQHSIELFRQIRWSEGVYCPKCHSFDTEKRGKQGRIQRYQCNNCKNNFNDFTNTLFHKSQAPLGSMLYVMFNLKNKNIRTLSKETGLTRQTIYRIKKLLSVKEEKNKNLSKINKNKKKKKEINPKKSKRNH